MRFLSFFWWNLTSKISLFFVRFWPCSSELAISFALIASSGQRSRSGLHPLPSRQGLLLPRRTGPQRRSRACCLARMQPWDKPCRSPSQRDEQAPLHRRGLGGVTVNLNRAAARSAAHTALAAGRLQALFSSSSTRRPGGCTPNNKVLYRFQRGL